MIRCNILLFYRIFNPFNKIKWQLQCHIDTFLLKNVLTIMYFFIFIGIHKSAAIQPVLSSSNVLCFIAVINCYFIV